MKTKFIEAEGMLKKKGNSPWFVLNKKDFNKTNLKIGDRAKIFIFEDEREKQEFLKSIYFQTRIL